MFDLNMCTGIFQVNIKRQSPCIIFCWLFQALWRCYAAEPRSNFLETWKIHMQEHPRHHHPNAFAKVARRASVIKKRRFSRNRFDLSSLSNHVSDRKESEGSVIFSPEDNKSNTGWYETIWHLKINQFGYKFDVLWYGYVWFELQKFQVLQKSSAEN